MVAVTVCKFRGVYKNIRRTVIIFTCRTHIILVIIYITFPVISFTARNICINIHFKTNAQGHIVCIVSLLSYIFHNLIMIKMPEQKRLSTGNFANLEILTGNFFVFIGKIRTCEVDT